MAIHLGDFLKGATVRVPFNTAGADGASVTIATNGEVRVYKDGGTTQITAGATLSEDFDAITGLHYAVIDTSDAAYTMPGEYDVAVVNNTIDGQTVSAWIGSFSLGRITAERPLIGLATAGAAGSVTLPATASSVTNFYNYVIIAAGTGAGQARIVTAYNGTTKVATVDPNWATNPDTTSVVIALTVAPAAGAEVANIADQVLAAAQTTPIHANVQKMNDIDVIGAGVTANKWRGDA